MPTKSREQERLITAMCLWEAVLELKERDAQVRAAFDAIGTCDMRWCVFHWCELVDAAWTRLSEEEQEVASPFDWAFVPTWLIKHIEWTGDHPTYRLGVPR